MPYAALDLAGAGPSQAVFMELLTRIEEVLWR
jgi:hypothetical protein